MTDNQKNKLSIVFNSLTDEQKKLDLFHFPYNDKFEKVLDTKEIISIEISGAIKNQPMFIGYSGIINLLRVSNGEIILKPTLIRELLS